LDHSKFRSPLSSVAIARTSNICSLINKTNESLRDNGPGTRDRSPSPTSLPTTYEIVCYEHEQLGGFEWIFKLIMIIRLGNNDGPLALTCLAVIGYPLHVSENIQRTVDK
jgi:hypothetical protein